MFICLIYSNIIPNSPFIPPPHLSYAFFGQREKCLWDEKLINDVIPNRLLCEEFLIAILTKNYYSHISGLVNGFAQRTILFNDTLQKKLASGRAHIVLFAICLYSKCMQIIIDDSKWYQPEFQEYWFSYVGNEYNFNEIILDACRVEGKMNILKHHFI